MEILRNAGRPVPRLNRRVAGEEADLSWLEFRLIVEIDGGQHNFERHAGVDQIRDDKLTRSGFRVLRFWNSDVDQNLAGVLQTIDVELATSSPHPAAFGGHPPPAGEG